MSLIAINTWFLQMGSSDNLEKPLVQPANQTLSFNDGVHNRANFSREKWFKQLLNSKPYTEIDKKFGREQGDETNTVGRSIFFQRLYNSIDVLRSFQAFLYRPSDPTQFEVVTIMGLGSDGDGHPGMAHGGLLATLLDQILGFGTHMYLQRRGLFTVELDIRYRNPVKTPCVVIGRTRVLKKERRRVWSAASLESTDGKLYADCTCLFIQKKQIEERL